MYIPSTSHGNSHKGTRAILSIHLRTEFLAAHLVASRLPKKVVALDKTD